MEKVSQVARELGDRPGGYQAGHMTASKVAHFAYAAAHVNAAFVCLEVASRMKMAL